MVSIFYTYLILSILPVSLQPFMCSHTFIHYTHVYLQWEKFTHIFLISQDIQCEFLILVSIFYTYFILSILPVSLQPFMCSHTFIHYTHVYLQWEKFTHIFLISQDIQCEFLILVSIFYTYFILSILPVSLQPFMYSHTFTHYTHVFL